MTAPTDRSVRLPTALAVVALALAAAFVTYTSPVDRSLSDSRYSLLVSQQMVDHGTVALDEFDEQDPIRDRYVIRRDGHTYYYFPLGTSVLATPAVLVAGWFGFDMADRSDEAWLQNLLSSAVVGLVVVLVFLLARSFTGRGAALVIAGASVFGSALMSSLGTALWSLDLAVLLELAALVLIVRHRPRQAEDPHPDSGGRDEPGLSQVAAIGVGVCLFAAFAVRPTTAPFILAMLVYLLVTDRRRALVVGATAAGSLLVWTITLRLATGVFVPDYYTLRRVTVGRSFSLLEAVHGHLLSPSRGLFVYSPILLAVVVGVALSARRLRRDPLLWAALGWIALHLLIASRATRWWAGPAFGPRILADALPAWILLTAMAWAVVAVERRRLATALAAGYVALAVPAIAINTYAGLYRPATVAWNEPLEPRVDRHPDVVFDWGAPQWLASIDSLCERERDFLGEVVDDTGDDLVPLQGDEPIDARSDDVVWIGWGRPLDVSRWSLCTEASVVLALDEDAGDADLVIWAAGNGEQRALVSVNGVAAGSVVFDGSVGRREVVVPAGSWRPGSINRIVFTLPDAATRDRSDARLFGIRLLVIGLAPT